MKRILLLSTALISLSVLHSFPVRAVPQDVAHSVATRVYDKATVFRKEDERLEKKVTVDRAPIHAGDLLEIFARQTGVSIEASDADGAGSEELVAVLKEMPLADAMECVTSLLSHKNVRWQWRREGDGKAKPYTYRLMRPVNAIPLYAEQAKAQIYADFQNEADAMIAGLNMSPEEIKRKAKDNPRLNSLLNYKPSSLGIRAFRDDLTQQQRTDLLSGKNPQGIRIPLNSLGESGKQLEAYMHDDFQKLNPGRTFNVDSAKFGITNDTFPDLVISFGDLGGWTYLGGNALQAKAVKRELKDWIHDNEAESNSALEEQNLPKPKDREATEKTPGNNQMPGRFAYMGQAGNFSVLARLERDATRGSAEEPWHLSIGNFLRSNEKPYELIHKWHKTSDGQHVLLVDYMGWYQQDTDPAHPRLLWDVVKRFQVGEAGIDNESLMIAALYASAAFEDMNQRARLAAGEYPLGRWLFTNNRWIQPLALFIAEKPSRYTQLTSPEGIAFKMMPDTLRRALLNAKGVADPQKQAVVDGSARIVLLPDTDPSESFRLEVMDNKGNLLTTVAAPNWQSERTRSKDLLHP